MNRIVFKITYFLPLSSLFVWASTTKTSAARRWSTCGSQSSSSSSCCRPSLVSPPQTCGSGTTTRNWASWSGRRSWSGERRRSTPTTWPTVTTSSWTRSRSSSWESWRDLLAAKEWFLALRAPGRLPAAQALEMGRGFDESLRSLLLTHHHHLSGCSPAIASRRPAGPARPPTDAAAEKLPRWKLRAASREISLDPSRIRRRSITGSSFTAKCFPIQRRIEIPTWYYFKCRINFSIPQIQILTKIAIFVIHSEI